MKSQQHVTAATVIIGNEILSGKVKDTNSAYLCKELRFLGVDLQRIITIPDEFEVIGPVVKECSEQFTWVFTSGGIGPTHDDVTVPAIAKAFGVVLIEAPELVQLLENYYKGKLTPEHLRMARVPEGTVLLSNGKLLYPQAQFRNIFMFPGIPELLQDKFAAIKDLFQQDPIFLEEIFLREDESYIAHILDTAMEKFPELLLGSYPVPWKKAYTLKLTLESRDQAYLKQALAYFHEHLPQEKIVNIHEPVAVAK
ncbi:competence/damage-inducible protein A [Deltaproteobacteria bacterium TL4]